MRQEVAILFTNITLCVLWGGVKSALQLHVIFVINPPKVAKPAMT